jgi:serine/threonine-protein kinase
VNADVPSTDGAGLGVGSIFGRWKLLSTNASGGTSTLYLARHTLVEGHRAALKVMRVSGAAEPARIARFREEAQVHGSLLHPNVPEFYDADLLADGTGVVVLEHLDGFDLHETLRRLEAFALGDALFVTLEILRPLAVIHPLGVHRDVKPSNVFLCRAPVRDSEGNVRRGRVRLLDFGFARLAGRARLTREGEAIGTLGYMAPEQLRGEEAVPASDLYAVGLVLFEMLAGHRLFASNDGAAPDPVALRRAHLLDEPPLATELPALPEPVRAFLASLLAKEPGARPSARDAVARCRRLHRAVASTAKLFVDEANDPIDALQGELAARLSARLGSAARIGGDDPFGETAVGIDIASVARAVLARPASPMGAVAEDGWSMAAPTIRDAAAGAPPATTIRVPPTTPLPEATTRTPEVARTDGGTAGSSSFEAPSFERSPRAPSPSFGGTVTPDASYGTAPAVVKRGTFEFELRIVQCVRALVGRPRFFKRPALYRPDGALLELRGVTKLGTASTADVSLSRAPAPASGLVLRDGFEIELHARADGLLDLAPGDDECDLADVVLDGAVPTGRTTIRHGGRLVVGPAEFRLIDLAAWDPRGAAPRSTRRGARARLSIVSVTGAVACEYELAGPLTLVGSSQACELSVRDVPDVAFAVWMRADDTLEVVSLDTSRLPLGDAFVAVRVAERFDAYDLGAGRTLVVDNGAELGPAGHAGRSAAIRGARAPHWRRAAS